ncbi:hypothetical protein [Castellaniella sp. S9]|uniref:hypothetical protein n=1 Tax=Castellaniella sp. S9 TaxID=2993652 RepID=UPI0022B37877|nr:hypothetical protein [Castellaniella sp. S9]
MQVGTPLTAPKGFQLLEAGLTYYLLCSDRATKIVHLVLFTAADGRPLAYLYSLPRDLFETGLTDGIITNSSARIGVPPFLKKRQGQDLSMIDLQCKNRKKKKSDLERAEERLFLIAPLLERRQQIMSSPNPEKEINSYATANKLNAQRIRLWFFSYLCFGQSLWTLTPRYFNCGHWDRLKHPGRAKLGRPSIARGALAGLRLTAEDIERIKTSYKKRRADGRTLTSIYQEAMARDFNAHSVTDEYGIKRIVSSGTIVIPTIDQYRYQIKKAFGLTEVQRARWGETKHRRRNAQHRGKFSSSVSNLLERVEADAYFCEDRPKSYIDDQPLPPLCVARVVDTASALRLGIGFSFGSETNEAYNAAQFCAAISKKKFCALFNINIEEHQWPSSGLSPYLITDRGPGIKREPGTQNLNEAGVLIIREFTPSGQGQSKGIVESSQRRVTKQEGLPRYKTSNLTPYTMAVREIRRLLAENQSANAIGHMTPEMKRHGVAPNPTGIYNFLNDRARNDGLTITFDEAARRFLTKVTVSVGRDGVTLLSQRYNSDALLKTGILQRTGRSGIRRLEAFLLPLCVRHIWISVDSRLIEVDAQLNLRDDPQMLFRSYAELQNEDGILKKRKAEQRTHTHAAIIEQLGKFETDNGKQWHSRQTTRRLPSAHAQQRRTSVKGTKALLTGKSYES